MDDEKFKSLDEEIDSEIERALLNLSAYEKTG
jgi:hypothetical protein